MPINSFLYPGAKFIPGYEVANSCRFDADAYMVKNIVTPTNQKKYTISVWVKRSKLTSRQRIFSVIDTSDTAAYSYLEFQSDDRLNFDDFDGSSTRLTRTTDRKFRDPSAWINIIIAVDTTLSSASSRVKMYINGTEETDFVVTSNASQDFNTTTLNSSKTFRIAEHGTAGFRFSGYMCEFVLVDGSQLDQTSFGEFDSDSPNIWKPIDVSDLTFGNNGFYLDFEDSSNLGNDANGGTDLTETSLAATDQSTDTCTNNFCTMNPLAVPPSNAPTFAEGNTKISTNNANANPVISTIGVSQGKWYAEAKRISYDGGSGDDDGFRIGFGATYDDNVNLIPPAISNSGHYFMIGSGIVYNGATDLGDKAGDSNVSDDGVVGIALDLDNNRISWSFNGAWMTGSDAWSGSSPSSYVTIESGKTYFFLQTDGSNGRAYTAGWNFGGTSAFTISSGNSDANGYGNFEYAPPSGYYALCTKNLAEFG